MAKSTASHKKVTSVSPCLVMSSSVITPRNSNTPKPMKATLVVLSCSMLPKTQPATISTKVPAVIHSSRDIRPMAASSLRAAAGASGVLPTPGGKSCATIRGSSAIAMSEGTDEARSHFPKSISSPACWTICTAIGLADVAVIHNAEETARPAIEQNMR